VSQQVVAAPNISRNGQPVKFLIQLKNTTRIQLSIFTLTGEKVFEEEMVGNQGLNTVLWKCLNQNQVSLSSGLYVFAVQMADSSSVKTEMGKVVIIR
jgi:hypothetical protein